MGVVDAVAQSIMAGCDFSDKEFEMNIPAAVQSGKLTEARLDDALTRVLRVRFELGEFDPFNAVPYSKIPPDSICSPEHRAVALKASQESIVLLQNRGNLLPLDKSKIKSIAVIGSLADEVLTNNYNGKPDRVVTALQGIKEFMGADAQVTFSPAYALPHGWPKAVPGITGTDAIPNAVAAARAADIAIVFVGTTSGIEDEARDRKSLGLFGDQEEVVEAVMAANHRTIVVQMSAGPLTVPWIARNVPAMIQAWWPGEEGGHAIADVLFGVVNPAGRMPHTVYASESQVPPQDEYDISKGFTYMYVRGAPLYPFGYGLSYTTFAYSNLTLSPRQIPASGQATVSVDVQNTGARTGDEVVQLYVHDANQSSTPRPAEQLRGFRRITLGPGEKKTVSMIVPASKLAFWDVPSHAFVVQPGAYDIRVGASSADIRARDQLMVTTVGSFPP